MANEKYPSEVIADMVDSSPLNAELCEALAAKWNRKLETDRFSKRGFIAKSRTVEGVTYERQPVKVTKTGAPVVRKAELVEQIATALGVSVEDIESIEKGSKDALMALRNAVVEEEDEEEDEEVFEPNF